MIREVATGLATKITLKQKVLEGPDQPVSTGVSASLHSAHDPS